MTYESIEAPTPVQIEKAMDSCYLAGWPRPDQIIADIECDPGEKKYDFNQRMEKAMVAYKEQLADVVEWALMNGKTHMLFRLGKLAETDVSQALYLLGSEQ